jgi:hypothetical protein
MFAAIKLLGHPLALLSLIALIGIAAAEIASANVRRVFSEYPVSVGLLTGLITLAFTLSIVNQFVLQRAADRWQQIRGITLKGLNDEVRCTRDILWIAIFGESKYENNNRMVSDASNIAMNSGFQWLPAGSSLFVGLSAAVSDGRWTETGAAILRVATQQLREGLARWTPATVLAGGNYSVLSPTARLADIIEALEYPLQAGRRDQADSVDDKYRQPLCTLWRHALTTCVYVEEDIVRVLYPERRDWFSKARELLSASDLDDLAGWLADAETFNKDTADRKTALTGLVPEPW